MSFASDVKMKLHGSILKQKKENALNCSDFCGSVDPFPYQGKKWAFILRRKMRLWHAASFVCSK